MTCCTNAHSMTGSSSGEPVSWEAATGAGDRLCDPVGHGAGQLLLQDQAGDGGLHAQDPADGVEPGLSQGAAGDAVRGGAELLQADPRLAFAVGVAREQPAALGLLGPCLPGSNRRDGYRYLRLGLVPSRRLGTDRRGRAVRVRVLLLPLLPHFGGHPSPVGDVDAPVPSPGPDVRIAPPQSSPPLFQPMSRVDRRHSRGGGVLAAARSASRRVIRSRSVSRSVARCSRSRIFWTSVLTWLATSGPCCCCAAAPPSLTSALPAPNRSPKTSAMACRSPRLSSSAGACCPSGGLPAGAVSPIGGLLSWHDPPVVGYEVGPAERDRPAHEVPADLGPVFDGPVPP